MKTLPIVLSVSVLISCTYPSSKKSAANRIVEKDTILVHDTTYINNNIESDWQVGFGLSHDPKIDSIWGKPVSYYINDSECSALAADFYYGYFRPSDNGATTELLKLACTDNQKLRPFYRWCLDKTLFVSDGALAELVGVPARKYAEKFPDEFFEYLDKEKDKTKYETWAEEIQYSGFFDYPEFDDSNKLIEEHYNRMSRNLKIKSEFNLKRVRKFAKDCQAL